MKIYNVDYLVLKTFNILSDDEFYSNYFNFCAQMNDDVLNTYIDNLCVIRKHL